MMTLSAAAEELTHCAVIALTPAELLTNVAHVLHSLVCCDSVGIYISTPGPLFQVTQTQCCNEPFTQNGWRYLLEHNRSFGEKSLKTGFIRASDTVDASTRSRLSCYRDFFAVHGFDKVVSRSWVVDKQLVIVNLSRQTVDFTEADIVSLNNIAPHIVVAVRMSQLLMQTSADTVAEFCDSYYLSPRQRDITKLLVRGMRNNEIADLLGLTPHTVPLQ